MAKLTVKINYFPVSFHIKTSFSALKSGCKTGWICFFSVINAAVRVRIAFFPVEGVFRDNLGGA